MGKPVTLIAAVTVALTMLHSPPLAAQARWRLQEVARIGGAAEGLASFNDIRDLQLDAKGQVWVLDFQAKSLRLFAADGTPVREVARNGRGPGEIANSNGFRRFPDGRMVVRDHSLNQLTLFDAEGRHVGQVAYPSRGYGWRLDAGVDQMGRFHELVTQVVGTTRRRVIVRAAADFARNDTVVAPLPTACSPLPPPPNAIAGRNGFAGFPLVPTYLQAFAASGAYWCASSDEYRIRRFPFGATTHDRELRLDAPRIPIPGATRDSVIAETEKFLERIGGALEPWDKGKVPRDRGPLRAFVSDERDRLWVVREMRDGTAELDVWDPAGRRVAVLAPGFRAPTYPLMRIHGDRLAIVLLDEDDLPTIFLYRILTS